MPVRATSWISRQSWWWVFALFIAVPAVALALLGLTAIRADGVEREIRMREQQDQLARVAEAALATAFDREITAARMSAVRDPSDARAADVLFEIDDRGVVWFPNDRTYGGEVLSDDPAYFPVVTHEHTLTLIERAASARAQGRTLEAVAVYEQLRQLPQFRDWAEWELALTKSPEASGDLVARYADPRMFPVDARAPAGMPLAMVVAAQTEALTRPARDRAIPMLERTLHELRTGRWWLTLDQRRAYDAELQRWLATAHSNPTPQDERLQALGVATELARSTFAATRRLPDRAQIVTNHAGRTLVIWERPGSSGTPRWSGVAISPQRSDAVVAGAIEPVLTGQPFHPVLQDRRGILWGGMASASGARRSTPMPSIGDWSAGNVDLVIRDLQTGEERSYSQPGLGGGSPRWLPDGKGVLVVVSERLTAPRRPAFYKVDLSTGSFQRLFDLDVNGRLRTGVGGVSPDGKVLYLGVRADGDAPVTGIVAVDLATGDERQVVTFNSADRSSDFGIAVSPDGSTLAVTVWTKAYASGRLFTVGTDGSGYRELVGTFATGWLADKVRWTPDGRSIVFTTFDARKNWRIMRVAAEGGPLAFDGLDYDVLSGLLPTMRMWKGNFNNIDLSPDGSRIVVSALTSATFEIWTLDGLMNALDRH